MSTSAKLIPAARTRTTIWPSPGSGSATSAYSSCSGPPVPRRTTAFKLRRCRHRRLRELLPEGGLLELADARLRDLADELEAVGQPPLRELRGEVLAELLVRRRLTLLQHDDRERPFGPLLVGHRDHGRLGYGRMGHERVLEVDGRDPFAARLDHVLRSVLDLNEALRMHGHDVAGLEPAVVGPAVGLRVVLVVARRDPGAPDLELAHRLLVPRHVLAFGADADLDERQRHACHG